MSLEECDGTEHGKCYFKETRTESLCVDIEGAQAQSLSVADPSFNGRGDVFEGLILPRKGACLSHQAHHSHALFSLGP